MPDSRVAVSARSAPTGAVTTPAPMMAMGQGQPLDVVSWLNVTAPTAAKAAWDREI